MRTYVTLLYALIIWQGIPICQPSADPDHLPHILASPLQPGVIPLQPLAMRYTPPPPISVSLQGKGAPPLLPSALHAYAPLLW